MNPKFKWLYQFVLLHITPDTFEKDAYNMKHGAQAFSDWYEFLLNYYWKCKNR